MSPQTIRWALLGAVLLSVFAAPFLAKGDYGLQQSMSKNAIAISHMTQAQRNRLDRNFADYQKLDEATRQKLQLLHHQLEQDRAQHGELTEIMNSYMSWLKTLNPHQRDQLMKTSNAKARIALMQDVIRRQREELARRNTPPLGRRGLDFLPTMDEKTRVAIVTTLEEKISERLTQEQKQELAMLTGLKRDVRIFQLLKEYGTGVTPQPLVDFPPPEMVEIAEHISDYSNDPKLIDFIKNGPLPQEPDETRKLGAPAGRRLAILLMHSIHVELIRQRHYQEATAAAIDGATLEKFLNTLPADIQTDLLSREVSDFQADLRKQYLESKTEPNFPQKEQLDEIFFGKRWMMFNGRRPGDGRGGDGRGGNGGRPQRRGEGRDPRDDGFFPGRPPDGPFDRMGPDGPPRPPMRPEPPPGNDGVK